MIPDRVSALFSISDGDPLPAEAQSAVRALTGEWVEVNRRAGRILYDAVVHVSKIETIRAMLLSRNPDILGVWNYDGSLYDAQRYPFKAAEYLELMRDIVEYDVDGNVISAARPPVPAEQSSWAGWPPRAF